jgi:hypothetical protein
MTQRALSPESEAAWELARLFDARLKALEWYSAPSFEEEAREREEAIWELAQQLRALVRRLAPDYPQCRDPDAERRWRVSTLPSRSGRR